MTDPRSPKMAEAQIAKTSNTHSRWWMAARRAFTILVCLPSVAFAAELLPPLQALRTATFTLVAAERIDAPMANRKFSLRVVEVLRGPAPEQTTIEVAALEHEVRSLAPGTQYLVVYNEVERDRFQPRKQVRRPNRRQLVRVDGASPAVFPDTQEMRKLLAPEHREAESLPSYRNKVVSELGTNKPAMLDLWSAELALRPGTFDQLSDSEIAAVRAIVADEQAPATARSRLLIHAFDREPAFGDDWFEQDAATLITFYQPEALSDQRGLDELIYNAMVILQKRPSADAAPALREWLRSSPSLAENAAWALRAIDPAQERDAVVNAISAELTPEATRRMLTDYLRRLDLRKAKQNS